MHFLFYGLGAILIAWGVSDIALNFDENGVRPLVVTYSGITNVTVGFILMGLGRCIQLLQNLAAGAGIASGKDRLSSAVAATKNGKAIMPPDTDTSAPVTPKAEPEPVEPDIPEPVPETIEPVAETLDDIQPPLRGDIIQEGDIRGYPFRIYESGEIELETRSGWHIFKTIEEVQAHITAETA